NNNVIFDRREFRTLTYSLSYSEGGQSAIFSNEKEINYALQLLNSNWRDSFIIGIIDCYLNNWETENRTSLNRLAEFISEKLKAYNGNRNTINAFKNNLKYFDLKNGDLVFGNELALKNAPIKEATKVLSLPESWFSYPYFSKVMVAYYEKKQNELSNLIDDFESALDFHKNSNTNKRIVSRFIIQANKPEYATLQDKVKHLAFKFIGDPENKSVWADFFNATDKEKSDLLNSRKILNEWITRQFINVFFNVCLNDERRKIFWLKYAPQISSFKVYGPSFTKTLLKRDERISEYLDARFTTVYSNRDVSAFILYIGEYMIIEFSNEGFACCAYKLSSPNRPTLNSRLNSVEDLRNSSLPLAIQSDANYYYTSDEGRLFHNSNWEHKFNHWLKEKVLK
ncbi:MAG TPA: EH signature domain-containing protein, partial [Chitinophagales bacterium]|nr:EH signature domain-containing protein [Chitinophagales bacterium]